LARAETDGQSAAAVYSAPTADAASAALDEFARGPWGKKFPMVVAASRRAWTHLITFFAFPPDIRRVMDEAATKLIRLALRNITAKWTRGATYWKTAMRQFAILYEDRFPGQHA
jgi:putative transposase